MRYDLTGPVLPDRIWSQSQHYTRLEQGLRTLNSWKFSCDLMQLSFVYS